jgi:hypothetical protein
MAASLHGQLWFKWHLVQDESAGYATHVRCCNLCLGCAKSISKNVAAVGPQLSNTNVQAGELKTILYTMVSGAALGV